jgi:hypothetical protein
MKTLTHDQIIRLRIIKAFGVTESRMFWLEWNAGIYCLENQCMGHEKSIDMLQSEPYYWHWFMQQWYAANELFVINYAACSQPTWGMFIDFHKHFLNDENMSKSYMHYMTGITKRKSKKLLSV